MSAAQMKQMGIDLRGASLRDWAKSLVKSFVGIFGGLLEDAPTAADPPLSTLSSPNYVVVDVGFIGSGIGGGALVTITRQGHVYLGPQLLVGSPGYGRAVRAGTIMGDRSPPESAIDDFVGGFSAGMSGSAGGVAAGITDGYPGFGRTTGTLRRITRTRLEWDLREAA